MTDRDLDARVAVEVMGWLNVKCDNGGNVLYGEPNDDWNRDARADPQHGHTGIPTVHREIVPSWHSDIAAAWEVLENIKGRLFSVRDRFIKALRPHINKEAGGNNIEPSWWIFFLTPKKICLAGLEAVKVKP